MERFFCKVCKTQPNKYANYCSIECIGNDLEFHEMCKTINSKAEGAKKLGIPTTTFKTILKKLNIDIFKKEKVIPVKICPKCNKEHTSKYGIHCSKSCANSRTKTDATRKKISNSQKNFYKNNPNFEEKRKKLSEALKEYNKNNPRSEETKKKMSEIKKELYKSEELKKKQSETMKEFYKNNPISEEERKKRSERTKNFHENNPNSEKTRKKMSESKKEYYKSEENKKKTAERIKEYYKNHPERLRTKEEKKATRKAISAVRRARKLNAFSSNADLKLLAKIHEYCPDGYHVDHIIPLSKGGLEHQDNLQYLPAIENIRKGARLDYVPQGVIRWQDVVPQ